MIKAVVVEKTVTLKSVTLNVRYRRKSIFCPKEKCFDVVIEKAKYSFPIGIKYFNEVKKLEPGDEIYVDNDSKEWTNPIFNKFLRRQLNLLFY